MRSVKEVPRLASSSEGYFLQRVFRLSRDESIHDCWFCSSFCISYKKKQKKTVYTQLKVSYMKTSNYNLRYQCETQLQFKSDYYILQFVICHIEWGII